jgi:hypothetical protein
MGGRCNSRSIVVRLVRWLFVLPQAGQWRILPSEEAAVVTRLVASGWDFSSAILGAFFSSPERETVADCSGTSGWVFSSAVLEALFTCAERGSVVPARTNFNGSK